jgi:hypothetical protein
MQQRVVMAAMQAAAATAARWRMLSALSQKHFLLWMLPVDTTSAGNTSASIPIEPPYTETTKVP